MKAFLDLSAVFTALMSQKGERIINWLLLRPHLALNRAIAYIEREMRGNYRNLICVRYEDIKICARDYSSEAFNIVPGTEYVLPQHLEDVYRWIHPRNPRPEVVYISNLFVRYLFFRYLLELLASNSRKLFDSDTSQLYTLAVSPWPKLYMGPTLKILISYFCYSAGTLKRHLKWANCLTPCGNTDIMTTIFSLCSSQRTIQTWQVCSIIHLAMILLLIESH